MGRPVSKCFPVSFFYWAKPPPGPNRAGELWLMFTTRWCELSRPVGGLEEAYHVR